MAMCVMAVVAVAPCQCFSPRGNQITSPGRMPSIGPPQGCARPQPAVTIRVWPSGWVCQAVRAPGSNVTLAPRTRAGSGASNRGSIRTVPVKYSAGPLPEGCEPHGLISMVFLLCRSPCCTVLDQPPLDLSSARGSLQFLARGPEQDLVHVHLLRLAHGEDDGPRERVGRNRNLIIDLVDALGDVRLAHAVRQFRGDRTRGDHRGADVVGLHFLP